MAPSLSVVFAALADPTRRAVVGRLSQGEATVSELAAPHGMSLPAVSKHVGVLVGAGLVERRKEGRRVVCSLTAAPLVEAAAWLTDVTTYWEGALDRLERLVTEEDS